MHRCYLIVRLWKKPNKKEFAMACFWSLVLSASWRTLWCTQMPFFRSDLHITHSPLWPDRRKIRLIEGNAKCRHLKKFTCTPLCGRYLSVWCPESITPPPLHTGYMYTVRYTYSHREGGEEGRVELERRFTTLGRKYKHDWLYLQSINYDEHLPQSPFTGQFI
jgi:hypothetical protein